MTITECLRKIEEIEMNPYNVVGGSGAFFSGKTTELTPAAKKRVAALNKKIDAMGGDDDED